MAVAGQLPCEPTVTSEHKDGRGTTIRQFVDAGGRLRLRQTTIVRHRKDGTTTERVVVHA